MSVAAIPAAEQTSALPSQRACGDILYDLAPVWWEPEVAVAPIVPEPARTSLSELVAAANLGLRLRDAFAAQNFELALDELRQFTALPVAHLLRAYFEMQLGHGDFARDELDRYAESAEGEESRRYLDAFRLLNRCLTDQDASRARMTAAQHFPHLGARISDFSESVVKMLADLHKAIDIDPTAELRVEYAKHKFRTSTIVYRGGIDGTAVAIKLIRFYNGYETPAEFGEAEILSRLDGSFTPRCIWSANYPDGVALVTTWLAGSPIARAKGYAKVTGSELRQKFPKKSHWDTLRAHLQLRIAALSQACVVHGDLGFDNILVADDHVNLIDFGLGAVAGTPEAARIRNASGLALLEKTVIDQLSPHWSGNGVG